MAKARGLTVLQVSTEPDAMHIVVKASMKMDQWEKHIADLWIVHRPRWSTASHVPACLYLYFSFRIAMLHPWQSSPGTVCVPPA
jgi:hypothetical protein